VAEVVVVAQLECCLHHLAATDNILFSFVTHDDIFSGYTLKDDMNFACLRKMASSATIMVCLGPPWSEG
jgi:hypothetical protein